MGKLAKGAVLILLLFLIPQSLSQLDLTIYRDGVVHVKIYVEVDESLPYVRIPLIGANISNVIAYNEEKELLNYEVENDEIEVYSLGSKAITLEYDTGDLTFKSRALWTLKVDSPFEASVIFPENATIMGISTIPKQISIENNRVAMVFLPGYFEVDYVIPVVAEAGKEAAQAPWIASFAIGSIIIASAIFASAMIKRKKKEEKGEEEKVLSFIKKSGGRALEAEIRAAFPEIPRTTLWRMLKRLEKKGTIRIKKVGLQNLVELT